MKAAFFLLVQLIIVVAMGALVAHLVNPTFDSYHDGHMLSQTIRQDWPISLGILAACSWAAIALARRRSARRQPLTGPGGY